jgi:hypothetical protein
MPDSTLVAMPAAAAPDDDDLLYLLEDGADAKLTLATLVNYIAGRMGAAVLRLTSDTGSTADSDPGNGLFKWNNATQGSASELYLDDLTVDGGSLTTLLAGVEPGGYMHVSQVDDATRWQLLRVTAITDASGYTKFGVTQLAAGASAIEDAKVCQIRVVTGVCETWAFACSDYKTTALAAATDVGGMIAPYAATVFRVWAGVHTVQTGSGGGGILTVDINEGASPTSILSTKITIDNGEYSSNDAATPPVISDAAIAAGAKITADIDQIGDGTAKGLTVYMRVFKA